MIRKKRAFQTQFHRTQIGRAQRFIRLHLNQSLSLERIAKEAGSSSYHFARLFQAYTGETPFDFLRRIRLVTSLRMLQEDPIGSITEISGSVGYETPSAFNKVFKKILGISPSDFRKLGKDEQFDLIYSLSKPVMPKEVPMNLSSQYQIINRPTTHFVFVERHGPFAEVAPPAWEELFPIAKPKFGPSEITEYLGLSGIDKTKMGEEAMIYEAGLGVKSEPAHLPKGLQYKKIKSGSYARFLLTGPYSEIWMAFPKIFKRLADDKIQLRNEFCIENYINDPTVTPEHLLQTELLVPIES